IELRRVTNHKSAIQNPKSEDVSLRLCAEIYRRRRCRRVRGILLPRRRLGNGTAGRSSCGGGGAAAAAAGPRSSQSAGVGDGSKPSSFAGGMSMLISDSILV